ncbi:MAG: hypothetical protein IJE05_06820 [Clostridia bacterium]|nr:hypothetical protein [Clostridia bacterium]
MSIVEKLKVVIGLNNPEKFVDEIAQSYIEKKENGEENPIDSTVEEIMQEIMENPNPDRIRAIIKKSLEKKEIPNRIVEKTAARISKKSEIPDKVITQAVERSETEVPDEVINGMLEEGEFEVTERLNLIKNVENEKMIKEFVKNELKILYKNCKEKTDNEVVNRVGDLEKILGIKNKDDEIKRSIQQIVANKMAHNYYNDKLKATRIYTLSQIMPVDEMIEVDLPNKVSQEYKKIEETEGEKGDRINKTKLRKQILDEMARIVAYKYKETEVFVIQQSDNMKKISKDEKDAFIKSIQNYSGKELTEGEIRDIEGQIKGNNLQAKENLLINEIKKIPEKNKKENIDFLIKLLSDSETLKTISMLEKTDVIAELNSIPEEKRKTMIESIERAITGRKEKIAIKTGTIKDNSQPEEYGEDR